MTAETDALRLVRELLALVLLKYGNLDPDVNKLTERSQEFLRVSPDSDLLKEAVGLLRPFADEAAEWSDDQPDRLTLDRHNVPSVTIGHCRAAHAFLSKVEERGHDAPQNPATEGVGS